MTKVQRQGQEQTLKPQGQDQNQTSRNKDQIFNPQGPRTKPSNLNAKDQAQITELFNSRFSSFFTTENKTEVPCPHTVFNGNDCDKLCDIVFIEDEVMKRLLRLREDKSAGVDDISSRFLKAVSPEVAIPATLLFSRSMSEGKVPHYWKMANVTPIFKQGSRNLAENYRPISLTCHLSKVMEST